MFDEDESSDELINMQESWKDTSKYILSYLLFVLIYIPYNYVQESINKQHKLKFFLQALPSKSKILDKPQALIWALMVSTPAETSRVDNKNVLMLRSWNFSN